MQLLDSYSQTAVCVRFDQTTTYVKSTEWNRRKGNELCLRNVIMC